MDVNNLSSNSPLERRLREAQAQQAPEGARRAEDGDQTREGAKRQRDDEVSLSTQARRLRHIENRVADQEAFDEKRVEEIRAAIAEGRYHIDPERLAERFVELESQLDQ